MLSGSGIKIAGITGESTHKEVSVTESNVYKKPVLDEDDKKPSSGKTITKEE